MLCIDQIQYWSHSQEILSLAWAGPCSVRAVGCTNMDKKLCVHQTLTATQQSRRSLVLQVGVQLWVGQIPGMEEPSYNCVIINESQKREQVLHESRGPRL